MGRVCVWGGCTSQKHQALPLSVVRGSNANIVRTVIKPADFFKTGFSSSTRASGAPPPARSAVCQVASLNACPPHRVTDDPSCQNRPRLCPETLFLLQPGALDSPPPSTPHSFFLGVVTAPWTSPLCCQSRPVKR